MHKSNFQVFDIAQPYKTDITDPAAGTALTAAGAVGDCVTDSFVFSSFGNVGSPMVCGYNTGQHSTNLC